MEYNAKSRSWAIFNFFILFYGCAAELYYGIDHLRTSVPEALDALCPVASCIMSLVKVFLIWWHRKDFRRLMQQVRRLTEIENGDEKLQLKRKYFAIATRLTSLTVFFAFFTSTIYFLRPIIMNIYRNIKGIPIIYETPFKMTFPDPLFAMPYYILIFLLVTWYGYITPMCFIGADGLFLGFCLYFAALLKILQVDVRLVLRELTAKEQESKKVELEVREELSKIIERHNEIAIMVEEFSKIMVAITLGHFVTSSVIIGSSVVATLLFSGYGILLYVVYTCAVLCELFLYCLGGNFVMDSSSELATTAYCSYWYMQKVKVQKMVLLLIIRAQREIIVKIPFFTPSLPMFAALNCRFSRSIGVGRATSNATAGIGIKFQCEQLTYKR